MKTNDGYASYTIPAKNMLVLCILEVLRNHSDEKHRLSQKDIMYYLEKDFSIKPNRTTIKSNLMNLIDFGYDIKCRETPKADTAICTEWYIEKAFSDDELDLIYNSILESGKISQTQCIKLMHKLKKVIHNSII